MEFHKHNAVDTDEAWCGCVWGIDNSLIPHPDSRYGCYKPLIDGNEIPCGLDTVNELIAAAAGGNNNGASATGDPHLQNIYGERFDLMKPGKVVLIELPRGRPVKNALLTVEADARRVGEQCADIYFMSLNITGAWADEVQAGGLTFNAQGARDETLQMKSWTKFGPLELKVAHGHTNMGIKYLNFYVKHLGHAGADVGGLLGGDDHSEAATPDETCAKSMSLAKRTTSNSEVGHASEAVAYTA